MSHDTRRTTWRVSAVLLTSSVASALRQDARTVVMDALKLQPEAGSASQEAGGVIHGVSFITKEHDVIMTEACAPLKGQFAADTEAKARLERIVPGSATDLLCGGLRIGAVWPDCPTYRDSFTLESACIDFPIIGSVPFHEGMLQMGRQMAWEKLVKPWYNTDELHKLNTFRNAEQHKHGSPLAPIYEDGRHIAIITNRQLKMKMIEQSTEWFCKGSHAIADGLRTESALKLELGALFMGKILHIVQDTFTLSHARRNMTPDQMSKANHLVQHQELVTDARALLQAIPIQQAYSMDNVSWSAHASVDKGRQYSALSANETVQPSAAAALENAAVLASSLVLRVFAELISDASSAGDASPELLNISLVRLGKVLCEDIWRFEDEAQGAGGSLKELGLNGDSSTWTPEVAADEDMKQRVSDELRTMMQDINEKRKLGKLALDPGIEFRYPSASEDYCSRIRDGSFSCAAVGYTKALSEPIAVDESWSYSLSMKIWFFVVGAMLGCAFVGCVVSRVRHFRNANAAAGNVAAEEGEEACRGNQDGLGTCLGNTALAPISEADEEQTATSRSVVSSAVSGEAKDSSSSMLLARPTGSSVGAGE